MVLDAMLKLFMWLEISILYIKRLKYQMSNCYSYNIHKGKQKEYLVLHDYLMLEVLEISM